VGVVRGVTWDGQTADQLGRTIGVPHLVLYESVTSTLDVAHELAEEGAPHGTLVVANQQTAGRGRRENSWRSSPDAGIWLAVLVKKESMAQDGILALRAGMALAEALRNIGAPAMVKWPNDIMVNGRKAAGILCEARWSDGLPTWVAVGVGVNVHGPMPGDLAEYAVSLDEFLGDADRTSILKEFISRWNLIAEEGHLSPDELAKFEDFDWLKGKELVEPGPGIAVGINEKGALKVRSGDSLSNYHGGHVVLARY